MTIEAGRALRLLRAVVVAGVATVLGSLAHALAGGRLPGVVGFAVLLTALVAATAPLLARPASTRRVVALVAGGQTLVHVVLTAASGHAGDGVATTRAVPVVPAPVVTDGVRRGNLADLLHPQPAPSGHGPTVPDWVLHLVADLQPAQLPMALAHLAAAVGVGWWLASGERALFALLAVLATPVLRLARLRVPVVPRPLPTPRAVPAIGRRLRDLLLAGPVARRGPPLRIRPA